MEEYEFNKSRIFYNTVLSYDGGEDMRVLMTDFSYGYSLSTAASSTRRFTATYPKFFHQSSPSATFKFVNTEEMAKFVDWVGRWQQDAVGSRKGTAVIKMRGVRTLNQSTSGAAFNYSVLITNVKYSRNVTTNAPSVSVNLEIVDDPWNKAFAGSQTSTSGDLAPNRDEWSFVDATVTVSASSSVDDDSYAS